MKKKSYSELMEKRDKGLAESGCGTALPDTLKAQLAEVNKFCANLQQAMTERVIYNLTTNVPAGILKPSQASAADAIKSGVVSTMSRFLDYGVGECIEFSADLCENVNAHTVSQYLRGCAR